MAMDDSVHDARPEEPGHSAVESFTEDDEINVEVFCVFHDGGSGVVLARV